MINKRNYPTTTKTTKIISKRLHEDKLSLFTTQRNNYYIKFLSYFLTEVAGRYELSTSVDRPMFVGAGLCFVTFFPKLCSGIYNWKNLLTYLVISSGNSHLLSSALETILTLFWTTESSSLLSGSEEELDDRHEVEDTFWFFPPSSLTFSFLYLWSLYCLRVGKNSVYWVYYCYAVKWPL